MPEAQTQNESPRFNSNEQRKQWWARDKQSDGLSRWIQTTVIYSNVVTGDLKTVNSQTISASPSSPSASAATTFSCSCFFTHLSTLLGIRPMFMRPSLSQCTRSLSCLPLTRERKVEYCEQQSLNGHACAFAASNQRAQNSFISARYAEAMFQIWWR